MEQEKRAAGDLREKLAKAISYHWRASRVLSEDAYWAAHAPEARRGWLEYTDRVLPVITAHYASQPVQQENATRAERIGLVVLGKLREYIEERTAACPNPHCGYREKLDTLKRLTQHAEAEVPTRSKDAEGLPTEKESAEGRGPSPASAGASGWLNKTLDDATREREGWPEYLKEQRGAGVRDASPVSEPNCGGGLPINRQPLTQEQRMALDEAVDRAQASAGGQDAQAAISDALLNRFEELAYQRHVRACGPSSSLAECLDEHCRKDIATLTAARGATAGTAPTESAAVAKARETRLANVLRRWPTLRIGQLLENALGRHAEHGCVFYMKDDWLLEQLEVYGEAAARGPEPTKGEG